MNWPVTVLVVLPAGTCPFVGGTLERGVSIWISCPFAGRPTISRSRNPVGPTALIADNLMKSAASQAAGNRLRARGLGLGCADLLRGGLILSRSAEIGLAGPALGAQPQERFNLAPRPGHALQGQ
jgi:hypothetical protein